MIDQPGRPNPRFPPEKEGAAAERIQRNLEELGAGPEDLSLCGGACGGDLLFAEAALGRELHLEIRIPLGEPEFLEASVAFAGDRWVERYFEVTQHPNSTLLIMPDALGPLSEGEDPFSRNNLWQLSSAVAWGAERVRFLCLWNGKGGDGLGGTEHMYRSVLESGGEAVVIDTDSL